MCPTIYIFPNTKLCGMDRHHIKVPANSGQSHCFGSSRIQIIIALVKHLSILMHLSIVIWGFQRVLNNRSTKKKKNPFKSSKAFSITKASVSLESVTQIKEENTIRISLSALCRTPSIPTGPRPSLAVSSILTWPQPWWGDQIANQQLFRGKNSYPSTNNSPYMRQRKVVHELCLFLASSESELLQTLTSFIIRKLYCIVLNKRSWVQNIYLDVRIVN